MQIIQPTLRDCLIIGGRTITDVDNIICLFARPGGGKYYTLRKPEASAGYVVPAAKVFRIVAVSFHVANAGAGDYLDLMYGDNDVGTASVAAPTNSVYPGSQPNSVFLSSAAAGVLEAAFKWDIPTGKYISVSTTNAGTESVCVWGFER